MDRGWAISRGCFGSSRLVVVHLEDVLLEVSDPVLLHRQRTVKLHLAEPDGETERTHTVKLGIMQTNTVNYLHLLWLEKVFTQSKKTQTMALNSSLWEQQALFKLSYCGYIRSYCLKIPNDSLLSK